MHGVTMKFIEAQQAKLCNTYKNTRLKLLRSTKRVTFSQILTLAPWRRFLCKPKHVGAFLLIL